MAPSTTIGTSRCAAPRFGAGPAHVISCLRCRMTSIARKRGQPPFYVRRKKGAVPFLRGAKIGGRCTRKMLLQKTRADRSFVDPGDPDALVSGFLPCDDRDVPAGQIERFGQE